MGGSVLFACVCWLLFAGLGRLLGPPLGSMISEAVLVTAATVFAAFLLGPRRKVLNWFTSAAFAAALLIVFLFATVLGTLVLQGLPREELAEKYGRAGAAVLHTTGLDDIFHGRSFRTFLMLLGLCLVLVALRRRAWRVRQWGFLLGHLGVVVLLIGGLVGTSTGARGFLSLHEGMTADVAAPLEGSGEPFALPFTVRLDDFELEEYPPELALSLYENDEDRFRLLVRHDLDTLKNWVPLGFGFGEARVTAVYPDLRSRTDLVEAEEGEGHPALRLSEGERTFILLAGVQGRDALRLPEAVVRFVQDAADFVPVTEKVPEKHFIEYRKEGADQETVEVTPGGMVRVGDYELTVLLYFPDFVYDTVKKEADTRSWEPRNPAIRVLVRSTDGTHADERWYLHRMPGLHRAHGKEDPGPDLVYRYEPERKPEEHERVFAAGSREVLEYRRGVLASRRAIDPGRGEEFFPGAVEEHTPYNGSSEWRNPAVMLEQRVDGKVSSGVIAAVRPQTISARLPAQFLVLERMSREVKAYRSRLSILEEGRKVAEQTVEVNHPLVYGGYRLYQTDYRPDDPTYSGIKVVKNPGLWVAYAGFLMMCAGILFTFYIRPRMRKAE
ncbi:MAG: cytochrome c biogenesis protein ResB [Planctomycetota bacterium]